MEEKKLPNEEIIQYYCCYRWCGLIPGLFSLLHNKKTRLTNSNFGEYPQVSCVSKKDEREKVEKKFLNKYDPLFIPKRP